MVRKILRVVMWLLLALLAFIAIGAVRNWDTVRRVFLGGLHTHETVPPTLPTDIKHPAVLVFSKTNAFRHEEAIPAGNRFFAQLASNKGWGHYQTENGAVFSPAILARFDAVVFDNASGDILTSDQWRAFEQFVSRGGGFVALHASGDSSIAWPWYRDQLIGATFIMHTMSPQFQVATVNLESSNPVLAQGLPASWKRTEEWYSFEKSPRSKGYPVLLTVDEKTYKPVGPFGKDLRMGADHPVAWFHCQGSGRAFYTAFGHRAEAFAEAETRTLLTNALTWALRQQGDDCPLPATPAAAK